MVVMKMESSREELGINESAKVGDMIV